MVKVVGEREGGRRRGAGWESEKDMGERERRRVKYK